MVKDTEIDVISDAFDAKTSNRREICISRYAHTHTFHFPTAQTNLQQKIKDAEIDVVSDAFDAKTSNRREASTGRGKDMRLFLEYVGLFR